MPAPAELGKRAELPFNPGEIVEIGGWPRWRTNVGDFELILDIVTAKKEEGKPELGIASFVMMEQERDFLNYVGFVIAESINSHLPEEEGILILTPETKGSSFEPYVSRSLATIVGDKLHQRKIVLRKGQPKVYMKRPAFIEGNEIDWSDLPEVSFSPITSPDIQTLRISPKDVELLYQVFTRGYRSVLVDDFIGKGGTIGGVVELFQKLNKQLKEKTRLELKPPALMAVVGSDGDLYKTTFEKLRMTLLPQPRLPLRLPTFVRKNEFAPWEINI